MRAEWASTKDLKALKAQIKAGLLSRPTPAPVAVPTSVLTTLPPAVGAGALPVAPVLTVVPVAPAVPAAAIIASVTVSLNPTTATASAPASAPTTAVMPATLDETALNAAVVIAVTAEDASNSDAVQPSSLLNASIQSECPGAFLLVTPVDTSRTTCNADEHKHEDEDAADVPATSSASA